MKKINKITEKITIMALTQADWIVCCAHIITISCNITQHLVLDFISYFKCSGLVSEYIFKFDSKTKFARNIFNFMSALCLLGHMLACWWPSLCPICQLGQHLKSYHKGYMSVAYITKLIGPWGIWLNFKTHIFKANLSDCWLSFQSWNLIFE